MAGTEIQTRGNHIQTRIDEVTARIAQTEGALEVTQGEGDRMLLQVALCTMRLERANLSRDACGRLPDCEVLTVIRRSMSVGLILGGLVTGVWYATAVAGLTGLALMMAGGIGLALPRKVRRHEPGTHRAARGDQ